MAAAELITSVSNPRIKAIRKLRERKERQASGLYFIEGLRIVGEALSLGAPFETVVASPQLLEPGFGTKLLANVEKSGMPVLSVSAEVFESLSGKEGPQGLAAVVHQCWSSLEEVDPADGMDWVVLDSIADPGNLGTILRTSDAAGAAGVILLEHSTDPFDPTAVRASMGSIFSQKVVRTSYAEFRSWKKRSGFPLVGTSGASAQDYHTTLYPQPLLLLMGSERQGLPEELISICDQVVAIPMRGRSDSLNLAVATGIVLYEIFNQRRRVLE